MKIVINGCHGGFSLSAAAVQLWAAKKGRSCYFFKHEYEPERWERVTLADARTGYGWTAFDTTEEPKGKDHTWWKEHHIDNCPNEDRTDLDLIAVVEELGDAASGYCAKLKIVNIPDGTNWDIDEYDGFEHVAEKHRTWS